MKNFIFSMLVAMVSLFTLSFSLTSCSSNKSGNSSEAGADDSFTETPLFDDYVLISGEVTPDGATKPVVKTGLKKGDKIIIKPKYDGIVFDFAMNVFKCETDPKKYTVADMDGKILREGLYDNVTMDEDSAFYRFRNDEGIAVYSTKAKTSWGMYDDVVTTDNFLFSKKSKKWGMTSLDGKTYFDRVYDKIYVVNYKSERDFDVVTLKDGKWELCDQDQSYYDASETEIKNLIHTPLDPVGVLDVKF